MINGEVNTMENMEERSEELEQEVEKTPAYTPRPLWQVIGAWVLLVIFIALMISGYVRFFGGAG